jgi:electron transfer flavoprotein alpha subunit
MKALLVFETRQGKLLESCNELLAFASALGAAPAVVMVGKVDAAPAFGGKVYLADAEKFSEYDPDAHKALILAAAENEGCEAIILQHSSYGWDMAPRLAAALKAAQVSEIVAVVDGGYEVPACNAKLRRLVKPRTARMVLTIQAGAFSYHGEGSGTAQVEALDLSRAEPRVAFVGYEAAEKKDVDLAKAAVIVSAGRGVGKQENVELVASLARSLGGELGATRPVVDAGWVDHSRQVGSSGQTVSPKLYVACGISGSIQHIAGMKRSDFIVAINKDKDAPIGEVANVLIVADLLQFIPALSARLGK